MSTRICKRQSVRGSSGFTLVEILIVVIILGILAAIVIPQFTNASNDARQNSVASTLQTCCCMFKERHCRRAPTRRGRRGSTRPVATNNGQTVNGFIRGRHRYVY